jgi:hypothetical protein
MPSEAFAKEGFLASRRWLLIEVLQNDGEVGLARSESPSRPPSSCTTSLANVSLFMNLYLIGIPGCGAHVREKKTLVWETINEGNFHHGGNRSDRIFCGFFHRDPRSGKGRKNGIRKTSGTTLLPVIRSRNELLYKLRAMRGNGCRHRWRLQTAGCGRCRSTSSSAPLTNRNSPPQPS